jgi:3-oxoacyl-[acyl-carrier protein] reductase
MALADRVVVIPGATGAAGRAAAAAFAAEGCKVGLIGTDAAKLGSLAAGLDLADGRWHGAAGDVTKADDVRRVVAEISEALGPVDVLVHVVGGWLGGIPAVELDPADVATSFDQHVFSTLHMVQAVVPGMRERGWGRIVNVGSSSTREPIGGLTLSNSHRPGLVGFLKTLAREVASNGVTVNDVATGRFATDRLAANWGGWEQMEKGAAADVPAGRLGQPDEYGDLVAFLCSDRAAYLTGTVIPLDGGLLRSV